MLKGEYIGKCTRCKRRVREDHARLEINQYFHTAKRGNGFCEGLSSITPQWRAGHSELRPPSQKMIDTLTKLAKERLMVIDPLPPTRARAMELQEYLLRIPAVPSTQKPEHARFYQLVEKHIGLGVT